MTIPRISLMLWGGLLGLAASNGVAPDAAPRQTERREATYIIPIEGGIENALLYVLRRGLRQAEAEHAGAIVLVMDTPGGRLDAADEIVRLLLDVKIPTYTFVKKHAFSAGAIIALATDHIYMAPGSVIGDAMPIMLTPTGGVQEMPEALEEKMVSGVAALIRSAAQQKGHDPQLAEAMVRREMEYKIGDTVISPAGRLLTLTNVEAEQPVGAAQRPLLSEGTVKDLDALLTRIRRADSRRVVLEVTAVEQVARVIASLSFILLGLGLLGLYIEFKTPGFGLPGIVGMICLAVFFWGHHIAGLAGMEDLLVFAIGLTLVGVEIFFFPGFGVAGVAGLLLMLVGLTLAMLPHWPSGAGMGGLAIGPWDAWRRPLLTVTGALILAALAVYAFAPYWPRSRLLGRVILGAATARGQGFRAAATRHEWVGLRGTALNQLRPSGTARFGEQRLDVVTRGELLEAGAPVRIVAVQGRRVVVEKDV